MSGRRRFGGEWQTKRLGDHLRFLRHGSFPRSYLVPNGEVSGGVKYLHYGDIHTSERVYLDPTATALPTLAKDHARRLDRLGDGDLVFVDASEDIGGVGKSIEIMGSEGHQLVSGLHTIAVRFKKAVLADGFKAYLQFCPRFRDHLRRLAAGTKVYATNRVHIATAELRVPPLPEQRAIAAVLGDVDAQIGSLEALIAKKRAIKQAAMQQLLTGRTRLPGFTGEWASFSLGALAEIRNGGTPRTTVPEYWNGDIPWCTPTDVTAARGRNLVTTARSITAEGLYGSGATLLPKGALLLCSRATVGEVRIASMPVATNQGFKSLVCGDSVDHEYLYYGLLTLKEQMVDLATGSTFLEISKRDVANIRLLLPSRSEQHAIAAVLTDMDAEIAGLERRLDKTRALKRGMMQQLLTGSIRLPIPVAITENGPGQ